MVNRIMVGLPSLENREVILRKLLSKEKTSKDLDYKKLATMTEGYSGSDLKVFLLSDESIMNNLLYYTKITFESRPSAQQLHIVLLENLSKQKDSRSWYLFFPFFLHSTEKNFLLIVYNYFFHFMGNKAYSLKYVNDGR